MIVFKDVVKSYNGVIAVNKLNLTVEQGELCILLGLSGCGKSTSLNMVNKLIEADSGSIYINGKNINEFKDEDLRRSIGYAVQSTALFPHMTVSQNISIVPKLLKWKKEKIQSRVEELLELVGLDVKSYMGKYPNQLSGGEAQRVGVARALAADPEILLMDEPFGALDPINRANIQNEFLRLQEKLHKTIIFVTHDMGEAMKMGDKIALMGKGKLLSYGTPKQLLMEDDNSFVKDFMGADSYINMLERYLVKEYVLPDNSNKVLPKISEKSSLKEGFSTMINHSVDKLQVVDQSGKVLGVLRVDAILNILNEEYVSDEKIS